MRYIMNMLDEMEKLGSHIKILHPLFDRFCENFDFHYANPSSIGRYPRIRIIRESKDIELWIDLWMELNEQGQRYTIFDPSLPYELSGGASIHCDDGTQYGYRYFRPFIQFSNRPFYKLEKTLYEDLINVYEVIKKWNIDDIIKEGKQVKLG